MPTSEHPSQAVVPGEPEAGEAPQRVLVVDDDAQMLMLTGTCLRRAGFEVAEATNAVDALATFQEQRPDLVLCDVVMPGMDGFELCGALRALPDGAHVPVVMMTGLEDFDSIERAYSAGATEFCVKPVNWSLLPRHIRFILKANHTREQLRVSEERYALAARGASDGLWDWDIRADTVYYSPRWRELLALEEDSVRGHVDDWLDRIHADDAARVRAELAAHFEGRHIWALVRGVAVRDAKGNPLRMAGSLTDVSERAEALQRLEHNALHDALTNLPNRALFVERLSHCIERGARHPDESFAVLFLDLDRFKVINDSLGHTVGDRLLIEVARRLRANLRAGETLARLGGDEFALLVEDFTDPAVPERVARRMHESLREPTVVEDHSVVTMASIGVTLSRPEYEFPEDLLRDADVAMYAAKSKGSGHTEFFTPEMHLKALRSLELERELRDAIERREITVHYQPIVALESGCISGFEALVRWQHPQRGLLMPDAFLDVAVDTGLIVPMGRLVMEQACNQLLEWQSHWRQGRSWTMAVNLCAQELMHPDLLEHVDALLERTGVDPAHLKLEVTERSLLGNLDQARGVMMALRERGLRMSVDDFGTGFSSFSYLQRLPFDALKIDRSFIAEFEKDREKSQIIQAMIKVAHELGLEVVAEGSEQPSSIECLRSLACEYAQGNLLAPAMSNADLEELLVRDDETASRALRRSA